MARWCRGVPHRWVPRSSCGRGARPGEDPHGRGRLLAHRAGEVRSRWCGWGSWDGPGRAVVQICCKGALRPDRPGAEPRNINDSSRASRPDGGLCNRFGQTAPPRARGNVRQGASRPGRRPRRALRRANGARGPRRRSPRAPPGAETCTSHSKVQFQPSFSKAKCTSRVQNAHLDREGTRVGRRVIAGGRRGQAGTGRARGRRPAEDCGAGAGPLTRWCAARSGPPGRGGCSPLAAGRAWPGYWRRAWRRRRRTGPGARRSARSTGPRP